MLAAFDFAKIAALDRLEHLRLCPVDHVLRFRDVAIDDGCEGGVFFALEAARAFELGFAFDDPRVGRGFAVEGLRLAVDDRRRPS